MYQADPPKPPKETLPTMYDLKSEDPMVQTTAIAKYPAGNHVTFQVG